MPPSPLRPQRAASVGPMQGGTADDPLAKSRVEEEEEEKKK